MENKPLVSVFIPYYNDQEFLKNSIESVLKQSYQNWELILCNHASTDNSREIAHSYKDERIKHVDMPKNYGAGGGLVFKTMLDTAQGKYVKTLCADDCLYSDCLEKMTSFMEKNSEVTFAFCDVLYINEKGKSLHNSWFNARSDFSVKNKEIELLKLYRKGIQTLPYIGAMVHRKALLNIHYDSSLIMLFDMSIWLQLLLQGKKMAYIPEMLAAYRCHDNQMSGEHQECIALRRSYFEKPVFHDFFAECENVDLIKTVFSDDKYSGKLHDKKDIPFIVYHAYFANSEELFHCYKLHELLDDERYRQHIIKEFGYDVDNYRKEYSESSISKSKTNKKKKYLLADKIKRIKKKVYSQQSRYLNLFSLIFLFGRQMFKIMTLSKFRKKRKKQYSL